MQPAWLQVLKCNHIKYTTQLEKVMQPAWLQVLKSRAHESDCYRDWMQPAWLQVLK